MNELVPDNHIVRVVDEIIDRFDVSEILSTYNNPRMMLKVLVFAYLSNVYSSRRIAELLKRDVYFVWLAGMKRPDFCTINYFRGKRLKAIVHNLRKLAQQRAKASYFTFFYNKITSKLSSESMPKVNLKDFNEFYRIAA